MKSRVGKDGVLHLDLPLGLEEAEREVEVAVERMAKREMTAADLPQSGMERT